MYADYNFYQSVFGGGLTEAEFNSVEPAAEAYVRYLTYVNGDIFAAESGPVKLALCAAVETVAQCRDSAAHGEAGIKSESNDGYSISRVVEAKDGETSEQLVRRKVLEAIRLYLLPTGWLRRTLNTCPRRGCTL